MDAIGIGSFLFSLIHGNRHARAGMPAETEFLLGSVADHRRNAPPLASGMHAEQSRIQLLEKENAELKLKLSAAYREISQMAGALEGQLRDFSFDEVGK